MTNQTNYDKYEKFISSLVKDIKQTGRMINNLECGRTNTILGASGQKRQIDVSFVDDSFPESTIVLLECKLVSYPVNLSVVKIIKATLDDVLDHPNSPNKGLGIIVATDYFRSGAQRFADFYGIKIETVPHGPPYQFKYENVVLSALPDFGKGADYVIVRQQ